MAAYFATDGLGYWQPAAALQLPMSRDSAAEADVKRPFPLGAILPDHSSPIK